MTLEQVEEHAEGLVCLSGCARDGALAGAWERGETAAGEALGAAAARRLRPRPLPGRAAAPLLAPRPRPQPLARRLAERLGVPCVATGNVHSHDRRRARLQDALVAVAAGETLEESEPRRRGNSTSALASPAAMAARFAEHPEAVAETLRLAERLRFDLTEELGYRYPGAEDAGADRELAEVCRARLAERYAGLRRTGAEAEERLEEELATIRHLGLSGFFLLHRDLLELAREVAVEVRGPGLGALGAAAGPRARLQRQLDRLLPDRPLPRRPGQGRPLRRPLPQRGSRPRDARHRPRLPARHPRGADPRASTSATAPTARRSSPPSRPTARAARCATSARRWGCRRRRSSGWRGWSASTSARARSSATWSPRSASGAPRSPRWRALLELCGEAMGLPRHASQHPGGMVISTRPLIDVCPVVPAAMEGRQIVQWDKDSCADAGFLKIDLLGLGMLSAVERCVEEIGADPRASGSTSRASRSTTSETFESIRAAETTGVFQIESRAQMQMLPRTRPRDLDDLTVQVALVRPGPIQGGAIHPYIERRKRLREDPGYEVPYEHPLLRAGAARRRWGRSSSRSR